VVCLATMRLFFRRRNYAAFVITLKTNILKKRSVAP